MIRKLRGMSLLAVPVMAVAALLGSVMPASAATGPDGFTILHADSGNIVHHCEVIGTDGASQQAVVCVDILTGETSDGYYAEGQVEAYCQTTGGVTIACQGIYLDGLFASAGSSGVPSATQGCSNISGPACGTGRLIIPIWSYDYTNSNCTTTSKNDVWAEVVGDTDITTYNGNYLVQLTGANDGSSYSSGHYWICA
jgi:hypothetical protein